MMPSTHAKQTNSRPANNQVLFRTIPKVGGPLYREVKRSLIAAIEGGSLEADNALPSERELAKSFGTSVGTIRRAVDELVAEHIVVRRQGLGTFVAVHNVERFMFQYFHVEQSDGVREFPAVELLSFERTRMDEDAALALGVTRQEPCYLIENRLRLQGRPVIYDRLVIPAVMFKGLTEKRFVERPSTIYHLFQTEFGITVIRARESARAVIADRTSCRILGLASGTPVMEVRRTALSFGDKPVEYRVSTISTARHEYVHMLTAPSS